MTGISANTGGVISGIEHIEQSMGKIITTPPATRVGREWFGNPGMFLLGNNMTDDNILKFFTLTWVLIELFEPRYEIVEFDVVSLERGGIADFVMPGRFKPYAHLEWEQSAAFVSLTDSSVAVYSLP